MVTYAELGCKCGAVKMLADGRPIVSVECLCNSCKKAGAVMGSLAGAPPVVDAKGATSFVLFRKDRLQFLSGAEFMTSYRLSPSSSTQRVIANCCNTPIFAVVKGGHWLSLYAHLWPDGEGPPLEMRTMAGDAENASNLPNDVPNYRKHSLDFYRKLFSAWVKMGFRNPSIVVNGDLHV